MCSEECNCINNTFPILFFEERYSKTNKGPVKIYRVTKQFLGCLKKFPRLPFFSPSADDCDCV